MEQARSNAKLVRELLSSFGSTEGKAYDELVSNAESIPVYFGQQIYSFSTLMTGNWLAGSKRSTFSSCRAEYDNPDVVKCLMRLDAVVHDKPSVRVFDVAFALSRMAVVMVVVQEGMGVANG